MKKFQCATTDERKKKRPERSILNMFAVRFDPSKGELSTTEPFSNPNPLVPKKRTAEVDESESEPEEQTNISNGVASNGEMLEQDQEVLDREMGHFISNRDSSDSHTKKHSSVISRFQQSLKLRGKLEQEKRIPMEKEGDPSVIKSHPLQQIPQPPEMKNTNSGEAFKERRSVAWRNTTKFYYNNQMVKPFASYQGQLCTRLLANIQEFFSENTFPIQTVLLDTILPVLNFALSITKKNLCRRIGDILVNASTGSGKTLAYSIPIIQMLSERRVNKLRAIIVVPTKLLIGQVFATMNKLAQGTSLIISVSKSEHSLKEEHQKFLNSEPDILIVTPGRMVDHLQIGSINMKNVSMLVLDEADHLLNQSFQNWSEELVKNIASHKLDQIPGNIVKLVFSATLSTNTEKLHRLNLYNPKLFLRDSVKLYNLPDKLQEYNIHVPTAKSFYKPLILLHLLETLENARILVFVKSNEASLRLAFLLNKIIGIQMVNNIYNVLSVNSNNTKRENRKVVHFFATSNIYKHKQILITTDLMARGIDINGITDVINYDPPISSQQYVHRCGRTARAQDHGNVHNILVGKGERIFWGQMEKDISRNANCELVISSEEDESIINLYEGEVERYKSCLENLRS